METDFLYAIEITGKNVPFISSFPILVIPDKYNKECSLILLELTK